MTEPDPPSPLAFDDVVIDFAGRRVLRAGKAQSLEPKAFAVLALLSIGILAVRMRRPAAWAALAGLVATFALGGLSVAGGLPLWAVVAHGAAATVMLAALATLLRR